MNYSTIAEIYAANSEIRDRFKETVNGLTEQQIESVPETGKWNVRQIVEHVAIVNEGMAKICSKLLSKAAAHSNPSDGSAKISDGFGSALEAVRDERLQAPEMVHPVHNFSIAFSMETLDRCEAIFAELRPRFETIDAVEPKFPHPLFGDLSAHEWLILSGAHEMRHLRQIRKLTS